VLLVSVGASLDGVDTTGPEPAEGNGGNTAADGAVADDARQGL
jgi:hypothetical protein